MSTLAVNTITNAAGGNTAQINGMTPTADSLQGFRNRIINGDMRIDQRNAGASVTPTGASITYTVDRFGTFPNVTSKYSVQQNAGSVTPPAGFTNYLGATSLSAYTVGASEIFPISQFIEGFNVSDLGWGTANAKDVTLSFWVRSSLTGTFGGSLANGDFDRSYPYSYTISSANTWEHKTITISGDTTGTWSTTNGLGLRVYWSLGAGSTYSGTAGAWAGTALWSATGAVSVVGTNGATFYITGVQLEAGSVATPFERRPYGTELSLCKRYYQVVSAFVCATGGSLSTQVGASVACETEMRSAPTVGLTAPLQITRNATADFTQSSVNVSISGGGSRVNTLGVTLDMTNFSGLPTDAAFPVIASGGRLTFSAEL
jgi:hypothetical protein